MRTCNKNQAVFEKQGTPKMMIHPGQQEDRQRVIARLGPDQQLVLRAPRRAKSEA